MRLIAVLQRKRVSIRNQCPYENRSVLAAPAACVHLADINSSCCFWTGLWKEEKLAYLEVVHMRELTIKQDVAEFFAEVKWMNWMKLWCCVYSTGILYSWENDKHYKHCTSDITTILLILDDTYKVIEEMKHEEASERQTPQERANRHL